MRAVWRRVRAQARPAMFAVALLTADSAVCRSLSPAVVRWHAGESAGDTRFAYHEELLRLALERTRPEYGDYTWETVRGMSQRRQVASLADGRLTVLVQPADAGYQRRFCAVKIPLDGGLLGYRVLLVRRADLPAFAAVRTVGDLTRFTVGQGDGWLDVGVWKANGFRTEQCADYDGLFRMLAAGRYDCLSRGVSQADGELRHFAAIAPDPVVEPTLCVHYPWPRYFYCADTPAGRLLAARIEQGVRGIMADPVVFRELFDRHHAAALRRLKLSGRRLLRLANPVLPAGTPPDAVPAWLAPSLPGES